jgi:hypothetical protein
MTTFNSTMKTQSRRDQRNINLFFGKRNQITLEKFDHLSEELRRSRTGTLDYLITHFEFYNRIKGGTLS